MTIILNGSTGITTPGLDGNAVGTDVQPYDSDLSNLTNLLGPNAYFAKSDPTQVAWTKTGNGTAKLNQLLHVEVNGLILIIAADTAITMPSLTAGTDYAIWCKTDGALEASSNHVTPPSANARRIGGFHYAPGGNAIAQDGGDTTAQINDYSFWDLKWRFAGADPRGMALVAGAFWADIYLLNTDPDTNGTSKYNVTIADGSSPPKIPTAFGGNGSTTYGTLTWIKRALAAGASCKRRATFGPGAGSCPAAVTAMRRVGRPSTPKTGAIFITPPISSSPPRDLGATGPTAGTPVRVARAGTTPLRSRTPSSGCAA